MPKKETFERFREQMNQRILAAGNREINRFFALDHRVYQDGVLPKKTKELMGLVASMVLRCDDCITYHIIEAKKSGLPSEALFEAFAVALVVGGSIVIPHLRRASELLEELEKKEKG